MGRVVSEICREQAISSLDDGWKRKYEKFNGGRLDARGKAFGVRDKLAPAGHTHEWPTSTRLKGGGSGLFCLIRKVSADRQPPSMFFLRRLTARFAPKVAVASISGFSSSGMHRAPAALVARPEPEDLTINVPRDPNTLANYHNFRTTHTTVHFDIDFEKKRLTGNVLMKLKSLTESETNEIVLDTRWGVDLSVHITHEEIAKSNSYLDIKDVKVGGKPIEWNLASRTEPYGSPLSVKLEHGVRKGGDVELDVGLVF